MIALLAVLEQQEADFSADVETLFEHFSDMVYRIAFVKTKSAADTDDVFQEVFLRLVRHAHKLRNQEHAKAWLIRCTLNRCNSLHTSAWNRKTVALEEYREVLSGLDTQHIELLEAVRQLSPEHQTVIHLFYYEGYSGMEIARMLGTNENTVKSRLRRARQQLRAVWGRKTSLLRNRYHAAIEGVRTPPDLKARTLRKLRLELAKRKSVRRRWIAAAAGGMAAAILVVAGLRSAMIAPGDILTPLPAGEHVQTVELRDGALFFQPVSPQPAPSLQLSPVYPIRQTWTWERYREAFPRSPLAVLPAGWEVQSSEVTAYFTAPGEQADAVLAAQYLEGDAGRLSVFACDSPELLSLPVDPETLVGEVAVGAGYAPLPNIYYATLEFAQETVVLVGEGMEQETFVSLILHYAEEKND